jgi:hypothetical protein
MDTYQSRFPSCHCWSDFSRCASRSVRHCFGRSSAAIRDRTPQGFPELSAEEPTSGRHRLRLSPSLHRSPVLRPTLRAAAQRLDSERLRQKRNTRLHQGCRSLSRRSPLVDSHGGQPSISLCACRSSPIPRRDWKKDGFAFASLFDLWFGHPGTLQSQRSNSPKSSGR